LWDWLASQSQKKRLELLAWCAAHIVDAVRHSTPPLVTGEDGVQAMEVAGRITDAVRKSQRAFQGNGADAD
jgi:hypothetical protein